VTPETRKASAEVLTTVAGFATAAGASLLNEALDRIANVNLFDSTLFYILPVGALLGGLLAASGYFVASLLTETVPSRRTPVVLLLITLSTWAVSRWSAYATPFGATSIYGGFVYVHELLQLVGFSIGGLVAWIALVAREICPRCSCYTEAEWLLREVVPAEFDVFLERAGVSIPAMANDIKHAAMKGQLLRLSLSLSHCPSCERDWICANPTVMDGLRPIVATVAPYDVTPTQAEELNRLAS
jgi:hypothetical protein